MNEISEVTGGSCRGVGLWWTVNTDQHKGGKLPRQVERTALDSQSLSTSGEQDVERAEESRHYRWFT